MCFNAARSIVCVETVRHGSPGAETRVSMPHAALCVSRLRTWTALSTFFGVSMPHAALCVSGPARSRFVVCGWRCFNAARSIVCVETCSSPVSVRWQTGFNAARSIVCVETMKVLKGEKPLRCFNAARSIVCVETSSWRTTLLTLAGFNAARSIVCVETSSHASKRERALVSMPHAALCVSRHDSFRQV